ncbi:MAG: hypothetical protein ACOYXB_16610 [Bacteroidota bacterium]
MKKLSPLVILLLLLALSCEKNEYTGPYIYNGVDEVIDTAITCADTLLITFGFFGDEEGISIYQPPLHAASCVLLNAQWEERILEYVPDEGFFGLDSLMIVTSRGSDGASPATDVDSVLIRISVCGLELKQLSGTWILVQSCGGYTGQCWYPAEGTEQKIVITPDQQYREYLNDSLLSVRSFTLTEAYESGQTIIRGFVFGDNPPRWYWFSNDHLNVQGGDFVSQYRRN